MAGAIVRGAGKQKVGAICNFVSFYVVGFPIGVSLMFPLNMGVVGEAATRTLRRVVVKRLFADGRFAPPVAGMWLGFLISVSAQSVFFTFYLYRLDWEKSSKEVRSPWCVSSLTEVDRSQRLALSATCTPSASR